MSFFQVNQLVAQHGLLQAVRGVSLDVDEGEVLCLIGANGAGKTTLLRTLSGVHPVAAGSVFFEGADISALSAPERVRRGIAMVPEGRRLFADMTVQENLQIAGENGRGGFWTLDTVIEALPVIGNMLKAPAGGLSGGQRQSVAIGRALMSNPRVLLLVEVSLGLSPVAIQGLYESLNALKAKSSTTMIVVEQDLERALGFADHFACMLEGRMVLNGRCGAQLSHSREAITHAYFGLDETPEVRHA
jgi:branched-chain amino acid transport system ATP-binding protein